MSQIFRLKVQYVPSWAVMLILLLIWPFYPLLFTACLILERYVFG